MNQYPLWRYILLALLIIFGIIYALPNIYGEDPAIQISAKESASLTSTVVSTIETALKKQNIPYVSLQQQSNTILVRFKDTETQIKAQDILQAILGNNYSVALNLAARTPA